MRIIELPIRIIDRKLAEMEISQQGDAVKGAYRVDLIESAYPSHDKETNEDVTHVSMVSGDEFEVYLPYGEFLVLWERSLRDIGL